MSESTQTFPTFEPPAAFQEAADKAREFNEQLLENAQKAVQQPLEQTGKETLERYVEWLENVADEQTKFADSDELSQLEGVAKMLKAQASFTKEFASSLSKFANAAVDAAPKAPAAPAAKATGAKSAASASK